MKLYIYIYLQPSHLVLFGRAIYRASIFLYNIYYTGGRNALRHSDISSLDYTDIYSSRNEIYFMYLILGRIIESPRYRRRGSHLSIYTWPLRVSGDSRRSAHIVSLIDPNVPSTHMHTKSKYVTRYICSIGLTVLLYVCAENI